MTYQISYRKASFLSAMRATSTQPDVSVQYASKVHAVFDQRNARQKSAAYQRHHTKAPRSPARTSAKQVLQIYIYSFT